MKSDYWHENDVLWGVIKDLVNYVELKEGAIDQETLLRSSDEKIKDRALLAIQYLERHQDEITQHTQKIELCKNY